MASITEVLKLCRLCLMKDEVNTPIFEDVNDISQVFLKISTCLPLKVSRDDNLPKNICDNCSYKLELFYEFLHTCTASEKQLITWLNRLGVENLPVPKVINTLPSSHISNVGSVILKQEVPEFMDSHSVDDITPDDLHISSEAQDYVLQQQQQLPYEAVELEFQQENFMDTQPTTNVRQTATVSSKALKRKRPTAGLKVIPSSLDSEDDEDDIGLTGSKLTKTEEDNSDNDADDTAFVDLPSTSGENDQPGPSGVGKVAADASKTSTKMGSCLPVKIGNALRVGDPMKSYNKYYCSNNDNQQIMMDYDNLFNYTKDTYKKVVDLSQRLSGFTTKWSCSICKQVMENKINIIEHYNQHKTDNEDGSDQTTQNMKNCFKCIICFNDFSSCKAYKKHLQLKHGENVHICEECNRTFKSFFHINIHHHNLHSTDVSYKCLLCNFNCFYILDFKSHVESHEKYNCDTCEQKFLTTSLLEIHKSLHTDALPV